MEIVRKITASNSLQPAYEAHIKNVAGTIEAAQQKLNEKKKQFAIKWKITVIIHLN